MDSLAVFRELLKPSRYYEQLPVQGEMEMSMEDNLTPDELPPPQLVRFFLTKNGSYIRMGDTEQLAEDGLLLLLDRELERITLSNTPHNVQEQLAKIFQLKGSDSSLQAVAKIYQGTRVPGAGDTDSILMRSRSLLPGTNLASSEIMMLVKTTGSGEPALVASVQRSLWPLTEEEYTQLRTLPEWSAQLLDLGVKGRFVIQERKSICRFLKITHDPATELPVRAGQWVMRNLEGQWQATAAFAVFDILEW